MWSWASENMNGALKAKNGDIIKEWSGGDNIMSVRDVLRAADINLDDLSDSNPAEGNSHRYNGIVLLWFANYRTQPDTYQPTYTYTIQRVAGAESKMFERIYIDDDTRIDRNRHGLQIIFVQTGQITRFNFQTLLVNLVSAIGLLGLATLVVDLLMLYLMPRRDVYTNYKYQFTESEADQEDRAHIQATGVPPVGAAAGASTFGAVQMSSGGGAGGGGGAPSGLSVF
eukprot:TRINITY_DN664_c0_g1_i4.p1 TRINITY_DN664_c0_g1~~TRINITY_DN664_c0_g1_i4.p1  ORF type:complete len:227 (-),score=85.97 TRINITY_DN664_c0_g1_i4:127-807(-)